MKTSTKYFGLEVGP